jgi:hypothetical protein
VTIGTSFLAKVIDVEAAAREFSKQRREGIEIAVKRIANSVAPRGVNFVRDRNF